MTCDLTSGRGALESEQKGTHSQQPCRAVASEQRERPLRVDYVTPDVTHAERSLLRRDDSEEGLPVAARLSSSSHRSR